jgi:hypothetical protein
MTFALVILASQLLLIALSLVFFTELILIVKNGSINFVEKNWTILILEVILSGLVTIFALVVFVVQTRRLGERRKGDAGSRPSATVKSSSIRDP